VTTQPTYRLEPLTVEQGEAMASWRYPGPWSTYDVTGAIDPAEGFYAVLDETDDVIGYACFGVEARVPGFEETPGVLDVGVGMRPDLVGQGRGRAFATAVLEHGVAVTGTGRLRAVVQDWNARSLRLLAALGFTETGAHQVGETRYLVLERAGRPPTVNATAATL
jgi:RimJ/RimL family protein N-acetyltransferase